MGTVFANGRAILHAGDGLTHVAAPPDVCKTPSPGGPLPIPYVNIAADSDLSKGTKSIKIERSSVALASSNLSTSTGDEPGTAGGVVSSKNKGKLTWATCSGDVVFEGKGVVRFMDVTQHNGNTFNTAFQASGGTGLAYADDFDGQCPICEKGPREHRVLEKSLSVEKCKQIVDALESAFKAQTDAAGKQQYARKGRKDPLGNMQYKGYMVGVMVCRCSGKSFAAMSGGTLDGFKTVAGKIVDQVIAGDGVKPEELARANTSSVATYEQKFSKINDAWRGVLNARESDDKEVRSGYSFPGACAGAKLLGQSGHCPDQMTEMFFLPPWDATYKWRQTRRTEAQLGGYSKSWMNKILQNQAAKIVPTTFSTGESVGSCHTCQEILFMTMCPERVC